MAASSTPTEWAENRPTRGLRGVDLGELWDYRELVAFLALRDVKLRYKQTAFGVAWAVLQPLAGMAVFTVVFRRLAGVSSDGLPYVVFAFAGYCAWGYVSAGVTKAMGSLVENASLVTKVWFPRIAAPLAAVLPGVIDIAVALVGRPRPPSRSRTRGAQGGGARMTASVPVTVVIPTRNRRAMFARTLDTVLSQCGVDFEVVVVDEASSDDTPDFLRSLDDERVRFVRNAEPEGVSNARNRGLFEARGRWVAFTDDDDLWAPDKLAAQLRAVAKTPRAGWSCVGCVNINEGLEIVSAGHPPTEMDVGWVSYAYNVVPGGGSGVLAATELVRRLGGFDPGLAMVADWEMWVRLANAANVAPVDRPLLGYLLHGGGMSRGARRSRWEFREMARRYRVERRREFGVDFFPWPHYLEWMADMELRAGRRWSPAVLNLEVLLRSRQRRQIKRVVGAAVAPGLAAQRHDRWMSDHVAPAWRAEADAWLAPLRTERSALPAPALSTV